MLDGINNRDIISLYEDMNKQETDEEIERIVIENFEKLKMNFYVNYLTGGVNGIGSSSIEHTGNDKSHMEYVELNEANGKETEWIMKNGKLLEVLV